MPDEFLTRSAPLPPRRGGTLRAVLGGAGLALAGGAALIGYLVWDGRVELALPQAALAPVAAPAPAPAAPAPAVAAQTAALTQQVAALEAKLAQLDAQAGTVDATTGRAEALLVVAALRRALERGNDPGPLTERLQVRFGAAQPAAVTVLTAAARAPVTLDRLAAGLEALAPALTGAAATDSGWDRFRRQVGDLFVIRRDGAPAVVPEHRLDRARLLLRSGQVDAAAAEVTALPAVAGREAWLADARRYGEVQQALATLETAALAPVPATP